MAFNEQLSELETRARRAMREVVTSELPTTARRIKKQVERELSTDRSGRGFAEYALDRVEEYRKRGQIGTYKSYRGQLRKFRTYLEKRQGGDVPFDLLDVDLLEDYRTYLFEEVGNVHNTVRKSLSIVRTFVRRAIKEDKMDHSASDPRDCDRSP